MLTWHWTLQNLSSGSVLLKKSSWKFCNIHWKTSALESLFNEVAGLKACNIIKKRFQRRCFAVTIAKYFINNYFEQHLRTTAWWKSGNQLREPPDLPGTHKTPETPGALGSLEPTGTPQTHSNYWDPDNFPWTTSFPRDLIP